MNYKVDQIITNEDRHNLIDLYNSMPTNFGHTDYNLYNIDKRILKRLYDLDPKYKTPTEELLIDKAQLMTLTAPEMTVLLGGMRSLGANYDGSDYGVFTENKSALSNDFFTNLLSMSTEWEAADESKEYFIGKDRKTGEEK